MKREAFPLGIFLVAALAGCTKKEPPAEEAPAPATSLAADRLVADELAEGGERAMGLAVPRDMRIERAFGDTIFARGHVREEALATYVQKRIDATTAEIGTGRTLFPRVHVKGQPAERWVRIEVVHEDDLTQLILRDVTPPPMVPGLSEEERWQKAGVVQGKPFDPSAL